MPKNQLEFEMPRTHLGRLADKYVKQVDLIKEAKGSLDDLKIQICEQLQKENRKTLAIEDSGTIYYFEIKAANLKLVVHKAKQAVGYQGHLHK